MSPGLGKVLDYRGVPMGQAVSDMQVRGIAVDANEMQQLEVFLLAFHQRMNSN